MEVFAFGFENKVDKYLVLDYLLTFCGDRVNTLTASVGTRMEVACGLWTRLC